MENETRAMIIKNGARKPLALGMMHRFSCAPNGMGGLSQSNKCYSFMIGDYQLSVTKSQ